VISKGHIQSSTWLFNLVFWLVTAAAGSCVDTSRSLSSTLPTTPQPTTPRAAAEAIGRLFGAALNSGYLNSDSVYGGIAGAEFNYVTPEWEMKWDPTEPSPNQFNFAPADGIMAFASEHGMSIKGHTLVWHYSLPAWVSKLTTAEDLRAAMTNHIQAVVGRYAGRIKAWDVVNEALTDSTPTSYRDTIFFNLLGETYIDQAFRAARAADPSALLFYNEANIDWSSDKLDMTYRLVQRLLAAGVPIDGVGFQMHVTAEGAPTQEGMAAALKRFTDLNLLVNFSELDVRVGTLAGDQAAKFEVQRRRYHDLVAACAQNSKCMSVTIWGVTDAHTWLDDTNQWSWAGQGPHYPLLFNADGTKKPAYDGTLQALLGN
jgi:endo-1,4-beta-xylanase